MSNQDELEQNRPPQFTLDGVEVNHKSVARLRLELKPYESWDTDTPSQEWLITHGKAKLLYHILREYFEEYPSAY